MPTYEYASLVYVYETKLSGQGERTWTSRMELWRPGATEGEIFLDEKANYLVLINKLGAEGWRFIDSTVVDSVVISPGWFGWPEIGTPVRMRSLFMREVSKA